MDLVIRKMEERDIDSVVHIENRVYNTPWSRRSFEMEVSENKLARYFVAELDNRLVAYAGIWLIVGEVHITNIAVDPDYRGRGISNYLMERMIDEARSMNCFAMTLEVRVGNFTAQNLYKKYGFKEAGIRPKYYADSGEDAIIMWKNFEDEVE